MQYLVIVTGSLRTIHVEHDEYNLAHYNIHSSNDIECIKCSYYEDLTDSEKVCSSEVSEEDDDDGVVVEGPKEDSGNEELGAFPIKVGHYLDEMGVELEFFDLIVKGSNTIEDVVKMIQTEVESKDDPERAAIPWPLMFICWFPGKTFNDDVNYPDDSIKLESHQTLEECNVIAGSCLYLEGDDFNDA
jgi:hypothetical protein